MKEMFPVFVGITGKRKLSDRPDQAKELDERVRRHLASVFDHLDRALPGTLKVLLTGAAAGTDLLAAEEILAPGSAGAPRKDWLVLAALPFEKALFKQDFSADQWPGFERVINDARTRTWVLPPLDKPDGQPSTADDLARRDGKTDSQKDLRRRHYEQVGLWIADTANILIAVMPADEPADRLGGTARIVAFRRGGHPDGVAADVINTSKVLSPRPELIRPPQGYVWLIDPALEPPADAFPATVLPPLGAPAAMPDPYEMPGALPGDRHESVDTSHSSDRTDHHPTPLDASMAAIIAARRRVVGNPDPSDTVEPAQPAAAAWPAWQDPSDVLGQASDQLRAPGYDAARKSRYAFYSLVALFLSTILVLELFAKFLSQHPVPLLVYIVLLCVIMGVYFVAGAREWQPIAEDRRAIREMLRVQRMWWRAGLNDRVDHVHLQGADQDLAQVREAARSLITWARLACEDRKPSLDWKAIYDPDDRPAGREPRDWIGSQVFYFSRRGAQREAQAHSVETLSWGLFSTSAWLAALLFLSMIPGLPAGTLAAPAYAAEALGRWGSALAGLPCVAGAIGCWWFQAKRQHIGPHRRATVLSAVLSLAAAFLLWTAVQFVSSATTRDRDLWTAMIYAAAALACGAYWFWKYRLTADRHLLTYLLGITAAVLLALAALSLAATFSSYDTKTSAKYMAIIFAAFLPAVAGGIRFLTEKLAIEAEALSYRDALGWYRRAEKLFRSMRLGPGPTSDDERARALVRHLGTLALGENEVWLRSRRQRPLSPVIGG